MADPFNYNISDFSGGLANSHEEGRIDKDYITKARKLKNFIITRDGSLEKRSGLERLFSLDSNYSSSEEFMHDDFHLTEDFAMVYRKGQFVFLPRDYEREVSGASLRGLDAFSTIEAFDNKLIRLDENVFFIRDSLINSTTRKIEKIPTENNRYVGIGIPTWFSNTLAPTPELLSKVYFTYALIDTRSGTLLIPAVKVKAGFEPEVNIYFRESSPGLVTYDLEYKRAKYRISVRDDIRDGESIEAIGRLQNPTATDVVSFKTTDERESGSVSVDAFDSNSSKIIRKIITLHGRLVSDMNSLLDTNSIAVPIDREIPLPLFSGQVNKDFLETVDNGLAYQSRVLLTSGRTVYASSILNSINQLPVFNNALRLALVGSGLSTEDQEKLVSGSASFRGSLTLAADDYTEFELPSKILKLKQTRNGKTFIITENGFYELGIINPLDLSTAIRRAYGIANVVDVEVVDNIVVIALKDRIVQGIYIRDHDVNVFDPILFNKDFAGEIKQISTSIANPNLLYIVTTKGTYTMTKLGDKKFSGISELDYGVEGTIFQDRGNDYLIKKDRKSSTNLAVDVYKLNTDFYGSREFFNDPDERDRKVSVHLTERDYSVKFERVDEAGPIESTFESLPILSTQTRGRSSQELFGRPKQF